MAPTIADILRDLLAAGLRQAEIARRTGIPQSRLSRWEGGAVPAGADDALRLKWLHDEITAKPADGAQDLQPPDAPDEEPGQGADKLAKMVG